MRCGKAKEWLSLEMDDQLPPDRIIGLEKHMEVCQQCRAYRADLTMGRRMLNATTPELAENFDWRLQLKLNQTLQQSAQAAASPWQEGPSGFGRWMRNFGASAALGMAAVLLIAIVIGPTFFPGDNGAESPVAGLDNAPSASLVADSGDRLPLTRGYNSFSSTGFGLQQNVSATRFGLSDAEMMQRLRQENQNLKWLLHHYRQENESLKARLDTSGTNRVVETQGR